jgi:hypothetical protein
MVEAVAAAGRGAIMRATTDFIVRSADNRPQLVIEVKAKRRSDPGWAASLRRNLFAHAQIPAAPYFLLALPDRFYLWKDATLEVIPPDYDVDTKEVLSPYLKKLSIPLEDLTEQSFELLIRNWLDDVTANNRKNWSKTRATAQLRRSGLYEAIKDGFVDTQVAV